jgi:hypothetical protein
MLVLLLLLLLLVDDIIQPPNTACGAAADAACYEHVLPLPLLLVLPLLLCTSHNLHPHALAIARLSRLVDHAAAAAADLLPTSGMMVDED